MKGVMNIHTFLLGTNSARMLCVALALVLMVACKPERDTGRATVPQGADQSTLPIGASQPVSTVAALIAFWPDPALPIDRAIGFEFGARIIFNAPFDSIAHIAAFALRPGETPSDCLKPQIPADRSFWAEQKNFAPGQHYYSRSFPFNDAPDTDRLVIRASVIAAGSIGQVLYCQQKIYNLTAGVVPAAPTPANFSRIQVALNPAQMIEGRDYALAGTVVVTASAPNAAQVEFFTAPLNMNLIPRLEYTDTDSHDGWTWHWLVPTAGFAGRVWAEAVQTDGTRTASPIITAMTLDVLEVAPLPVLTAVPLPGPSASWSPDGRYFATTDRDGGIVGEVNSQRVITAFMPGGVGVWRWTNDSRFVIFRWRHPHNNSYTYVFDTQEWKLIWSTPGCKFIGRADLLLWENCGDYPVALSPNAPRFLMMNGKLIDLPDLRQVDLITDVRAGQVAVLGESPQGELSAWSPDGSALAFVTQLSFDPPSFALYLAHGDGTQVRRITSLTNYPKSLQWSPDSTQVIVTTGPIDSDVTSLRYVLDMATGQVQVEQITALTPTPPVPPIFSPALSIVPCVPLPATKTPVPLPPTISATHGAQITALSVSPERANPGDTITLHWQAQGDQAILCPESRYTLFAPADCVNVPVAGAQSFVIPSNVKGNKSVEFVLTVSGAAASTAKQGTSVAMVCAQTWFFSAELQAGVCPQDIVRTQAAIQYFERGLMIWLKEPRRYFILENQNVAPGDIRRPLNTIADPLDIARNTAGSVQPPAGLFAPASGFGLIWRGDVTQFVGFRDQLGWALQSESGYEAKYQCDDATPSGGRVWQTCYLTLPDGQIIATLSTGAWFWRDEQSP